MNIILYLVKKNNSRRFIFKIYIFENECNHIKAERCCDKISRPQGHAIVQFDLANQCVYPADYSWEKVGYTSYDIANPI